MDHEQLIELARQVHGQLYAALLRADIEIAKRERATGDVPQAWRDKRRRMGRALDAARARFARELGKVRREFWRNS